MSGLDPVERKQRWIAFLSSVDTEPEDEEVRTGVAELFLQAGVYDPSKALGLKDVELLGENNPTIPVRGLLRRTLRAITQAAAVQDAEAISKITLAAGAGVDASVGSPVRPRHSSELPPNTPGVSHEMSSALALVNAIKDQAGPVKEPVPEVDIQQVLNDCGLGGVPSFGLVDAKLFNELQAHSKQKVGYVYVDLTQRDLLPIWMSPETVGGRTVVSGDDESPLDERSPTGNIQQLQDALKKATSNPRWFRSVVQWVPCFLRYSMVALATKQLKLQDIFGHMQTVTRIEIDVRGKSKNPTAFAILYDEMRRKNWASRAERGDPTLDISTEAWSIDEELLKSVGSRLQHTLEAAGVAKAVLPEPSSSSTALLHASRESSLAKQAAALEQQERKLASDRRGFESAKQQNFNNQSPGGRGSWKGGKGGNKREGNWQSGKGQNSNGNSGKRQKTQGK